MNFIEYFKRPKWIILLFLFILSTWIWLYNSNKDNIKNINANNVSNTSNNTSKEENIKNIKEKWQNALQKYKDNIVKYLPVKFVKLESDNDLFYMYFTCLPYNEIPDNYLNKFDKLKWKIDKISKEKKVIIKKWIEQNCRKLWLVSKAFVFYKNPYIIKDTDILPNKLIENIEQYIDNKEVKKQYLVLYELFSYKHLWTLYIVKDTNKIKKYFKNILENIKDKEILDDDKNNIKIFYKIIKYYDKK